KHRFQHVLGRIMTLSLRRRRVANPRGLETVDVGDRHESVDRVVGVARRIDSPLEIIVEPCAVGVEFFRHEVALELPGKKTVAALRHAAAHARKELRERLRVRDVPKVARWWRAEELFEQQTELAHSRRDTPYCVDAGHEELRWPMIGAELLRID